jgi:DNA-binding NarL/FixJ family response regulator
LLSDVALQILSILIVDDEPFMCNTIRAILRSVDHSFVVTVAGAGETALPMIADPPLRDTAVIMLTTHDDAAAIQSAVRLNIKGYLVKPVSPKQVGSRLRAVFRDRPPAVAATTEL